MPHSPLPPGPPPGPADTAADDPLALNPRALDWCVRAFRAIEGYLGLQVALHDPEQDDGTGVLGRGHIFLFNHFARFETIIPPYLIHSRTGAFCRTIADTALFGPPGSSFGAFLRGVGAVPNSLPGLLPFLAAEILRGRKVVIFPEGGMVKDRRVVDDGGDFRVYSRTAKERRKHHRGAAVLALMLDVFKERLRELAADGDTQRLERWRTALGFSSADALLAEARTPTLVVPGNITFYPLRIDDHPLPRLVERFTDTLPQQFSEELLVESNILFRDTDMDIRLGAPLPVAADWNWWERLLLRRAFEDTASLHDLFDFNRKASAWFDRLLARRLDDASDAVRDACTYGIYRQVTVNIGHLAAQAILDRIEDGETGVSRTDLGRQVYLALKGLQTASAVHLHRTLAEPDRYRGLLRGTNEDFNRVLSTAVGAGLLDDDGTHLTFRPKLRDDHDFDRVRLENPLLVAANEITPIPEVLVHVAAARQDLTTLPPRRLADLRFDDETRAWQRAKQAFSGPGHAAVNSRETATRSGAPFLLMPEAPNGCGVVLVHGFLASPAELQGLAERLKAQGYTVIGVRLPGHGTSPWDLRERGWPEWLDAVRRADDILAAHCPQRAVVGFGTGGALGLAYAAEAPPGLTGVVAASVPVTYRNKALIFAPLMHGLSRLAEWVPAWEGTAPFRENDSEHPEINYRHVPLRGLHEVSDLMSELRRRLPLVRCPALILQGDRDPVVDPAGAVTLMRRLASHRRRLEMIPSTRHGILNENIGNCHDHVVQYLSSLFLQTS
ncbi:alpha/beta fold hydrolase [Novispirillum itersonii]|uniref:alpha/beta fold hydrolase n=1 Tax=Novispirillum itersonii TaxID=189 RepID=UPI00037B8F31|nr:alpha/beta fold hydrolase [Novispirillum itersonii]